MYPKPTIVHGCIHGVFLFLSPPGTWWFVYLSTATVIVVAAMMFLLVQRSLVCPHCDNGFPPVSRETREKTGDHYHVIEQPRNPDLQPEA